MPSETVDKGRRELGLLLALVGVILPFDVPIGGGLGLGVLLFFLGLIFIFSGPVGVHYKAFRGGAAAALIVSGIFTTLIGFAVWNPFSAPAAIIGPPPTQQAAVTFTDYPTVDTTASLPSGSYTGCTSQNPTSSSGGKTVAGYVWAALSSGTGAVWNSGGPTSGTFLDLTGDQVAVTSGGGKLSTNAGTCWQMKHTWNYVNAPTPAGAQGNAYLPVYVFLTGISMSGPSANLNVNPFTQLYNNGSAPTGGGIPIIGTSQVGLSALPVLVKDAAGNWQQVCPNLQNQLLTSSLPTCSGMNVNQNPTTNAITYTVIVDATSAGFFGYATSDAAVGTVWQASFVAGIPCPGTAFSAGIAQPVVNGILYCTPTLEQWNLQVQRAAS